MKPLQTYDDIWCNDANKCGAKSKARRNHMNRHWIETSSINQWGMTKRRILKKNNVNVGKSTNVWLEERANVICLCTIYSVYIYIYTCDICISTKHSEWTKNQPQVLKFSPLPTPKINPFRIPRIVPVAVAHMKFLGLRWITSQDVWSFKTMVFVGTLETKTSHVWSHSIRFGF